MADQSKSRIYWRNRKAYGDFRDFADVGGKREALKPVGMRVPTTDPDVAAKLGVDYESLIKLNPRLVYCELTAYGREGPDADRPGYDMILQAMSGLL